MKLSKKQKKLLQGIANNVHDDSCMLRWAIDNNLVNYNNSLRSYTLTHKGIGVLKNGRLKNVNYVK
jgi:hypothetical protein